MNIVLASGNQGKLREFSALTQGWACDITPQHDLGIEDAVEDGLTFVENALIKARHASRQSKLPALADDSGLEVDALLGAPGIYSSRYARNAGRPAGDQHNCQLLLERMAGLPVDQRTARFRCVIVFLRHTEDPAPIIAQGTWEGHILEAPVGSEGFGYDPVFLAPETQCSAALLPADQKNALSHRGKALRSLAEQFRHYGLPGKLWSQP